MADKKAFTLIELLLTISLFVVLALISAPVYNSLQIKTAQDALEAEIIQSLRLARVKSEASLNNDSYGVYFATTSRKIVIYKGDSYQSREASYDISKEYGDNISFTSDFYDIHFSKGRALPDVYGDIFLQSDKKTTQITINDLGIIE